MFASHVAKYINSRKQNILSYFPTKLIEHLNVIVFLIYKNSDYWYYHINKSDL